ncbi:MAG TPA: hypothetical protein ENI48_13295 [Thioploca sp.]|nr:hypothetical protein [Thioploca sp.]
MLKRTNSMSKNMMIFAGPNGAGKTTLAYEYLDVFNYYYLSADAIATELAPDGKFHDVKIQAGRKFFHQLNNLIAEGKDIIIESTLSGLGFQRIIQRFKQANYTITISFIYLETPEVCIKRIKERVLKGGHHVPEKDVKRRFIRSKNNFWHTYKNQADYWHLFYNTNYSFIEVAIGQDTKFTVTDEALFKLFLRDLNGVT